MSRSCGIRLQPSPCNHKKRMIIFLLLLLLFCQLSSCSTSNTDIHELISIQIDSIGKFPRLNLNYHNFLIFAHRHQESFIIPILESAYQRSSSTDRWTEAIDFTVGVLAREQPDILEFIVNEHLIHSHPLSSYFFGPFKAENSVFNLCSYFRETEHEILSFQLNRILSNQKREIYSTNHISFLNLLFDYGVVAIWPDFRLEFHLAFLFRASFIDFDLVLKSFIVTGSNTSDLAALAENVYNLLYEKDKEQARMALKFSVNVRSTDLSHLSYSEAIKDQISRNLVPMLPQFLAGDLKTRHIESMNLPNPFQLKVVKHFSASSFHRTRLFWLIYNEFYLDPSKFSLPGYDRFWWSFLFSLVHKLQNQRLFYEISNENLIFELLQPIKNNFNDFLSFERKETDLFRSILINGHYATINMVLKETINSNNNSSNRFSQMRCDWIMKFSVIYGPIESTNFLLSLKQFSYSPEALVTAFSIVCSHGKASVVKNFLKYFPNLVVNDKILLETSEKGHFDIIKVLLPHWKQFSQAAVLQIAIESFKADNLVVVKEILLFSNNFNLNLLSLPFLFKLFAKNDIEICQIILDSLYFDDSQILEIVSFASYAAFDLNQSQVLWFLINDDDTEIILNQEAQVRILHSAISGNFFDSQFLRKIISSFKFPSKILKNSISVALKFEIASETVPLLLEFPNLFCSSEISILLSLLTALEIDNFLLFKKILFATKKRVTPFISKSLLTEICKLGKSRQNYIKIVLKSCRPDCFPEKLQFSTLILAVEWENFNLVKFIFNYGFSFSLSNLKRALKAAKSNKNKNKNKNIQNYLLNSLQINKR